MLDGVPFLIKSHPPPAEIWLRYKLGYRKETHGRCEFLILPPSSSHRPQKLSNSSSHGPILFLHGLGIGLGQYIPFLKRLSTHRRGVVILLQPNISADVWHRDYLSPPSKDDIIHAVKLCTQRHHLGTLSIVSHSNGTM